MHHKQHLKQQLKKRQNELEQHQRIKDFSSAQQRSNQRIAEEHQLSDQRPTRPC